MSRRTRLVPKRTRPVPSKVAVVKVSPVIMAAALRVAKGDRRRLSPQPDGSVLVGNHPGA